MEKLKISFLTNIFTNESYAFIPMVSEDKRENIENYHNLSETEKSKILDDLKESYSNVGSIKKNTIMFNINIEVYNINDFKHLIYKISNLLPQNQLIFVKNNNINDYILRLKHDNQNPKFRVIEEPLGFYYKNTLGKKCDNWKLRKVK